MRTNNYRMIGIILASLFLLAWPAAYLANRVDGIVLHPLAFSQRAGMPNHSGYSVSGRPAECPSPALINKSFRMGISLDQAPFTRMSTF